MMRFVSRVSIACLIWTVALVGLSGQSRDTKPAPDPARPAAAAPAPAKAAPTPQAAAPGHPDLSKEPTLYVVGYAHLDTQWRWDYPTTIGEYIPKTMRDNFALFEKYPNYVFNFSGANRYQMMKEYYPAEFARVKKYVAAGRWFPSGSSMEENDVNSPSGESLIRQILYGTQWFKKEFGKTSAEFMLPDCFGFPASLPSVLAHTGLKGFSTQKLTWHSATNVGGPDSPQKTPVGIPFNVGVWEGLDGKSIIAALNPGDYVGQVVHDLSKSPVQDPNPRNKLVDWPARVQVNGQSSGVFTDYHYFGTGDVGGAPSEASVKVVDSIVTKGTTLIPPPRNLRPNETTQTPAPQMVKVGDGPLHVLSANADQMFLDITPEQAAKLPRYKGDLELIEHSAGSITSQAYMKRWNRKNEILADAAERASIAADWMGGRPYPMDRLNAAWTLVMGAQFHDILPGTSIPKAYEYSWNDEVLALNQFSGVLTSATQAVASGMNTLAKGTALVVYNPLNISRQDVVEATVAFAGGTPKAVKVTGPDGKDVPAQLAANGNVVFLASVPSVGFAVYDVQPADAPGVAVVKKAAKGAPVDVLTVSQTGLENGRYKIVLDQNGDISSLFDKQLKKELLSAPIRLAFKGDKPVQWPAWNMDWADQQKAPRAYVQGPATVAVVENGPARVAVQVTREAEGSKFAQVIRLSAGDAGNRVEFGNVIDWRTKESNLKAVFPLTASNPMATYNWDLGTLQRGNNDPKKYEVASHQWFDLTDKGGTFGVTVLSDFKVASDKPDDNTLRLTLLRTPGISKGWEEYGDQSTQDWGRHDIGYGLASHAGDWRQGQTDWQAWRLNTPLVAFESAKHAGTLGKAFSLMTVSNSRVRALALKKAEQSDEIVVRLVELDGKKQAAVRIGFGVPLAGAREINGAESPVGNANVVKGELVTDFGPYEVRSFAVKLGTPTTKLATMASQPVKLTFDRMVTSPDGSVGSGWFDESGRSLDAALFPRDVAFGAIHFSLGPADGKNAVLAQSQTIALPEGNFNRLYLLAAASDGDQKATFKVGDTPVTLTIQDWGGYVGQWDNREWNIREETLPLQAGQTVPEKRTVMEFKSLTPGFIKPAPVAWFASHRHGTDGRNEIYAYSYLYTYAIDIPAGARTLTLPFNDNIKILAATVANEEAPVKPAVELVERLK